MAKIEPSIPTTFTPFLRRFTDEKARDLTETRQLYNQILDRHLASTWSKPDARRNLRNEISRHVVDELPDFLYAPFDEAIDRILDLEKPIFVFPHLDMDVAHLTLKEQIDLRRFLRAKEYFLNNEERVIERLETGIMRFLCPLAEELPQLRLPSPFTVPLAFALPDPSMAIEKTIGSINEDKYEEVGLFAELRHYLYLNACKISGFVPFSEHKKPFKMPKDAKLATEAAIDAYFANTALAALFKTPVPLKFTHETRFSHMHVLGGTGAGKTQLLQHLILHDLQSDEAPALVIIDSQSDLIDNICRLRLAKDPILITPRDIHAPPALNVFDVKRDRLGGYDEATREQVTAGVIQTFDYLFTGLLGTDLTTKQGVFFKFIARLLLSLPETLGRSATILDMLALMDDATPYLPAIERLPPLQRNFFEKDFLNPKKTTFVQTREQIRYRLNAILENPTFARLFTSPSTSVDIFSELNNGSIILVDTAKDFLKGASANFGRIFISLVLQAVLERAAIPESARRPAFLVVDEAANYFDSNIDDLLTEARKYKLGCVFAHQFLDQATSALKASFAANTAIKMVGGVSTADARILAPDLRTTPDFILSQPQLHFAAYMRNATPQAVSIPIRYGELESQPRRSEDEYNSFRERNRQRVSIQQSASSPAPKEATDASEPLTADGTAPSTKW